MLFHRASISGKFNLTHEFHDKDELVQLMLITNVIHTERKRNKLMSYSKSILHSFTFTLPDFNILNKR